MGENARAEGDVLVEVAVSETVAAELEFGGLYVSEVCVEDAEGVEFCDVVAADLVCTDEELDLLGWVSQGRRVLREERGDTLRWTSRWAPCPRWRAGAPSAGWGRWGAGGGWKGCCSPIARPAK